MSRFTSYRGWYYRFNDRKNCYEIGKYVGGKWELIMCCEPYEEPNKKIDIEMERVANENSN